MSIIEVLTCYMQVVWVPGSFELPLVAKAMAKSGQFDAVLTIGAVVSSPLIWAKNSVSIDRMLLGRCSNCVMLGKPATGA